METPASGSMIGIRRIGSCINVQEVIEWGDTLHWVWKQGVGPSVSFKWVARPLVERSIRLKTWQWSAIRQLHLSEHQDPLGYPAIHFKVALAVACLYWGHIGLVGTYQSVLIFYQCIWLHLIHVDTCQLCIGHLYVRQRGSHTASAS